MLTLQDRARPNAQVIVTEFDAGEAVLLHLETKMYYSLNATGLRIWKLLDEGLTLDEVGARLYREYDITPEKARQVVLDLAGQLHAERLLDLAGRGPDPA